MAERREYMVEEKKLKNMMTSLRPQVMLWHRPQHILLFRSQLMTSLIPNLYFNSTVFFKNPRILRHYTDPSSLSLHWILLPHPHFLPTAPRSIQIQQLLTSHPHHPCSNTDPLCSFVVLTLVEAVVEHKVDGRVVAWRRISNLIQRSRDSSELCERWGMRISLWHHSCPSSSPSSWHHAITQAQNMFPAHEITHLQLISSFRLSSSPTHGITHPSAHTITQAPTHSITPIQFVFPVYGITHPSAHTITYTPGSDPSSYHHSGSKSWNCSFLSSCHHSCFQLMTSHRAQLMPSLIPSSSPLRPRFMPSFIP